MDRRQLLQLGLLLGLAAGPLSAADLVQRTRGDATDGTPLSPLQRQSLAIIADVIIPDTDTAGAATAGVVDFIALMLAGWMYPEEGRRFLGGLADFERAALGQRGRPFTEWEPGAKANWFVDEEAKARATMAAGARYAPFVVWMKRLTVYGYYTSEVGSSQELELNLVPGEYQPCAGIHGDRHAFSLDRYVPAFTVDNAQVVIQ